MICILHYKLPIWNLLNILYILLCHSILQFLTFDLQARAIEQDFFLNLINARHAWFLNVKFVLNIVPPQ